MQGTFVTVGVHEIISCSLHCGLRGTGLVYGKDDGGAEYDDGGGGGGGDG